jgi:UDP-N-acetylmuramoyl-L-alanyl-D-glutamate--2,6-diaminopimelate ligase
LTATVVARNLCEQTFLLNAGTDTAAVRTRLLGDHHVYNCLTAAAVGLATGIDLTTIARGLEMVDDLAGRMERIDCGQEFAVFVDDARTPHAFAAALGTLREVTPGKVICVFGSDGGEDSEGRARLARTVERCADVPIISTTRPHDEPPPWIAAELLDGFESTDCASVILDRRAAIDHAFAEAQPGDTVLIAGRGLPPDDQAIVRELLQSHVPSLHLFRSAA